MGLQIIIGNRHHGASGEYIGRGTPLGNPYPITDKLRREEAIRLYDRWLNERINDGDESVCRELNRLYAMVCRGPLTLVCSCTPKPCHGEVIRRVLEHAYATYNPKS